MADSPVKSDIIISIRQPYLDQIVEQKKTHEFRTYLLPESIKRFWIYEPSPVSAIKYIAEISKGKPPGTFIHSGSVQSESVHEGTISSNRFGYEILSLEALDEPITLSGLKSKDWLRGAPQKYCYVKAPMAHALINVKTTIVFARYAPTSDPPRFDAEHEDKGFESSGRSLVPWPTASGLTGCRRCAT
jgi:hypothetical protein